MADVRRVLETRKNGLKVNLFEFDIENEEKFSNLKEYLINKVKRSGVHNIEEYNLTYYGSKNLNPAFVAKFNEQVAQINIPKRAVIPQFDVRRERVTEWMAQHLLEQVYGCTFYDEADKRLNLKTIEIDKHTDGIDVPGIWVDHDPIRFVICEVKTSQEKRIPCSSVQDLQDDIQKSIDNADNRVSREILQYMHGIRNSKVSDDMLERIIDFLARLIAGEKKDLAENLMFFPVLLRNNEKIISEQNLDDYRDFNLQRVSGANVENIVAAFGKDFSDFSREIYAKAIGD